MTSKRPRLPRPSFWQRLRGNFLTGLVIVVPVALTLWLVWTAVNFIDNRVMPIALPFLPDFLKPAAQLVGFGVLVFLVFTTFIGSIAKGYVGRSLLRWGERMVDRMPIVRSLYNGIKQIIETVLNQNGSTFQQACLIQYPRNGLWAIAFVSTDTRGEVKQKLGDKEMLSIFLPTTPNPTSGFLLFVPRKDVVMLDMDVEEAAKLVISAGLVVPPTEEEIKAGKRETALEFETLAD